MPIPELNENGLLPVGIHDCALEEIKRRFGGFTRGSDQRPTLFAKFQEYMTELKSANLAIAVIVNGSFTTDKEARLNEPPNDIDVLVVLPEQHDITASLLPFQYNLVSHRRVEKRYRLDVKAALLNSSDYEEYIYLYAQVRGSELKKGVLRITL